MSSPGVPATTRENSSLLASLCHAARRRCRRADAIAGYLPACAPASRQHRLSTVNTHGAHDDEASLPDAGRVDTTVIIEPIIAPPAVGIWLDTGELISRGGVLAVEVNRPECSILADKTRSLMSVGAIALLRPTRV